MSQNSVLAVSVDIDDDWADGAAESAEKNRNKRGQYKEGTLFLVLFWEPTKAVISAVKRCKYIKEYAGCSHELDVYSQEDLDKAHRRGRSPEWQAGDRKKPHVHVFLRCSKVRADTLAKALGIPVQFVQYVRKDQVHAVLCYLTHQLWPEKHQYLDSDVFSNYDWVAERDGTKRVDELETIVEAIDAGLITKTNVYTRLSSMLMIKYDRQIKKAFEIYDQRHKHDKHPRLCIYITSGVAGSGKSTLAEMLAYVLAQRQGWDYCYGGGGKDIFGEYNGEEIIILDDKSFGDLSRDQWLNMFDQFVKGSMDSRFKNKTVSNLRIIIVTNIMPFMDNVEKIKGLSATEDRTQFTRRFPLTADVQEDVITLYKYNPTTHDYNLLEKIPNHLTRFIRQATQGRSDALIAQVVAAIKKIQDEAYTASASWSDAQLEDEVKKLIDL